MVRWTASIATACVAGLASIAAAQGSGQTGPTYFLKTHVTAGDQTKDNLYLESFHTGAGLSDATLSADNTNAIPGFLNDTHLEFSFGNNVFFGMNLQNRLQSTSWTSVTINGGQGDAGFSIVDNTVTSNFTEFNGWLACDWWHGVPQLFYLIAYTELPSSCANVTLVTEAIS